MLRRKKGQKRVSESKYRRAIKTNIKLNVPIKERYPKTPRIQFINPWKYAFSIGREVICGICGNPITEYNDVTIDHIVPLSKGGSNMRSNLQPAHEWCNRRKGNRLD